MVERSKDDDDTKNQIVTLAQSYRNSKKFLVPKPLKPFVLNENQSSIHPPTIKKVKSSKPKERGG
jgi:hypothetical protein